MFLTCNFYILLISQYIHLSPSPANNRFLFLLCRVNPDSHGAVHYIYVLTSLFPHLLPAKVLMLSLKAPGRLTLRGLSDFSSWLSPHLNWSPPLTLVSQAFPQTAGAHSHLAPLCWPYLLPVASTWEATSCCKS